jgi:hypothetical protein
MITEMKLHKALCDGMIDYLRSDYVGKADKLAVLDHAHLIFDLTAEPPKPKVYSWDKTFQRHEAVT